MIFSTVLTAKSFDADHNNQSHHQYNDYESNQYYNQYEEQVFVTINIMPIIWRRRSKFQNT